ncbi:molybdopterin-dependent oxidoreductase [Cognatiyoonia sp. IB215182]|uniref:molybdopterin-dependent oxidoreductase n=1 Tax=Cognatiyoonia sp. IB215182 TaxID=3097353 RepID=UPI002A0DE0D5|nr:molybdopterin-dependent oxidoreductase [Cognatiyoonia sp. IB215182]MDX8355314.1 oxidoreductase [Cognatiyoonia sp. IB215182]
MTPAFLTRSLLGAYALAVNMTTSALGQDVIPLQVTTADTDAVAIEVSLETLESLDQTTFTTTTIWTDGDVQFSGVSLKALLAYLDLDGQSLEMVALNDYAVSMPVAELEDGAPILATRMNGETMSVRDKGPYWVVFPYDSDPKYSTETNYARSIWQLNRLKVVD